MNSYTAEIEVRENQTQQVSINRSLVNSLQEGGYNLCRARGGQT